MANAKRILADIEALRGITEPCEAGTTRIGFTEAYRQGAEYFKGRMREAGLDVWEDEIGNVYGRFEGENKNAPALLSGSHLDTVRCAGAFDGIAGAVCALEVARMLRENNKTLRHPFEVIGTMEEEGTRFGQVLVGSQFITGAFGARQLDTIADADGKTLREILREYLPADTRPALRGEREIAAVLELHDEQGPVLEAEGVDIGVVRRIVSISWLSITVDGFAGHAGTVPMRRRQDAAVAACRLVDRISAHATAHYADTATATVGKLVLTPGSTNCIASKAVFTVDLRAGEKAHVLELTDFIQKKAAEIAGECDVSIDVKVDSLKDPIEMDQRLGQLLQESCEALGYSHQVMNSGAGHDAMIFSQRWPTAMLFVPCAQGITHNPAEAVTAEALQKGADVLYETILRVDQIN